MNKLRHKNYYNTDRDHDLRRIYQQELLIRNQPYIGLIALAIGLFNIALIIPDIMSISFEPAKMLIILLRICYTLACFLIARNCQARKIKTFETFARLITLYEAAAIFFFLYIYSQYNPPDYMIQTMGMIIIIIVVFIMPNRWLYEYIVASAGVASYLIYSRLTVERLSDNNFWAGAVYLILATVLCALFAHNMDRHQYREFQAKNELIILNTIDPLTKASNRNKLIDLYEKWSAYCRRYQLPLALALFDIDNFKQINDDHGHSAADEVLVEMVRLINHSLRGSDSLARWGGDEFILLFPHTTEHEAVIVLERIRKTLGEARFSGHIHLTCSFGVVGMKPDSNLDNLIKEADKLMYQSKKIGGNCIRRAS
ncbi:MAG: GGDEF domain-containing protein [Clostridiaceae bacterium]|nr:GGDEF domain-containing protein [Clostridiaceae bacterium]